jgi:Na+/proline symporter
MSSNNNVLDKVARFTENVDEKWYGEKGVVFNNFNYLLKILFVLSLIISYFVTNNQYNKIPEIKKKNESNLFLRLWFSNMIAVFFMLILVLLFLGLMQYFAVSKTERCIEIQKTTHGQTQQDALSYCRQKRQFESNRSMISNRRR